MSSERPVVSIITAVYNGRQTLARTIASVASQSYPAIEYIVIDGGSTDGTLDVIQAHAGVIHSWVSGPDRGMYHAMNEGIARSTGALVGIINSDDWYEPEAIATVVEEFLATDRETVLYGITRYHDEAGVDMILSYDHRHLPRRMINHPATFVPRTLYDRFGRFDTTYRVAADYELLLRLYRMGVPFRHVERILANFSHGGFSARNSSAADVLRIQRAHGYLNRRSYLTRRAIAAARSVLGRLTR